MSGFPRYVDLEFTAHCNLKCGFCFGPTDDRSVPDLSLSFWKAVVLAISRRGCAGIVVSGGEPTLYRPLRDLLRYAKQLGMQIVLSTHGRHETRVKAVVDWCDWIALPVDAVSPNSLRALRGDHWGLVSAVVLAERLKSQTHGRIRIKLGTVATRTNLQDVIELAESLNSLPKIPFNTWKIYQYTPRRKFADRKLLYELGAEDFLNLSNQVRATGICGRVSTVFSSHDLRQRAYLFVYPDGTLAIPNEGKDFSDIVIGNLATEGEAALDRVTRHDLFSNRNNYETTYD